MILSATAAWADSCASVAGWEYSRADCTCTCREPALVFPPSGTVLPTNAVFHVDGFQSQGWMQDGERFKVTTDFRTTSAVSGQLGTTRPDEPLIPGASIELWALDVTPDQRVASWTVGEGPDLEPPTWTGDYEVETIDVRKDSCGSGEHSHYVAWEGLSDGPLFVLAEGIGEDVTDELGDEVGFDVRWDACVIESLSLHDTFQRQYRVTFEDPAGNTLGPFDVRTGRNVLGCGGPSDKELDPYLPPDDVGQPGCRCGGPAVPPAAGLLLAPIVCLARRRSTKA